VLTLSTRHRYSTCIDIERLLFYSFHMNWMFLLRYEEGVSSYSSLHTMSFSVRVMPLSPGSMSTLSVHIDLLHLVTTYCAMTMTKIMARNKRFFYDSMSHTSRATLATQSKKIMVVQKNDEGLIKSFWIQILKAEYHEVPGYFASGCRHCGGNCPSKYSHRPLFCAMKRSLLLN
jgi:hypothetical protein